MAMIEEFDKRGNWLFRWRSFLPLVLYGMAAAVIFAGADVHLDHGAVEVKAVCLAISLFGLVIRAMAIGFTPKGTSGRNTKEGQVAEVLNTKGIYSVCRHPLYLGNFFMWLGLIIYVGNWWFTALCVLMFWLYYERIMFAEEQFLRGKFGHKYLEWSKKTPPFIPRFFSWKGSGEPFSCKNVLKREYNGFFAVFLSFGLIFFMREFMAFGYRNLELYLDPFWLWSLLGAFVVFIVLRTLKKQTKVLDVEGREYS